MAMDTMAEDKKKILVAIPTEGNIPGAAYDNHLEFMFQMGKKAHKLPFACSIATVGGVFTPMAREEIAKAAIRENFDYVFMFDDDMILPMDCLERLYRHDVDVVAALAFMKRPPHYPVVFVQRKSFEHGRAVFLNMVVKNYPKNCLFECDAVGFGAVLIKTDIIRKMNPPYFMSTCGTGEDVLFCYNAKDQAGAKVFCDTGTRVGHLAARTKIIDETEYEKTNPIERLREEHGSYSDEKREAHLTA